MKRCTKCGEVKNLSEFPKSKQHKGGYNTHCKKCRYAYTNEWAKDNKEKKYSTNERYRVNNRETVNAISRRRPKTSKEIAARRTRDSVRRAIKRNAPVHEVASIKAFYEDCPEGYNVDHIVPLAVGGSHSLGNLQYLTERDNKSKGKSMEWLTLGIRCVSVDTIVH